MASPPRQNSWIFHNSPAAADRLRASERRPARSAARPGQWRRSRPAGATRHSAVSESSSSVDSAALGAAVAAGIHANDPSRAGGRCAANGDRVVFILSRRPSRLSRRQFHRRGRLRRWWPLGSNAAGRLGRVGPICRRTVPSRPQPALETGTAAYRRPADRIGRWWTRKPTVNSRNWHTIENCQRLAMQALTLARIRCFATFGRTGCVGATPPLAFPNEAS